MIILKFVNWKAINLKPVLLIFIRWINTGITLERKMMSTKIFYYTGTGNSLWVAKKLTEKISNAELVNLAKVKDFTNLNFTNAGFVFPVYIWGVPSPILEFIETIKNFNQEYCFAVAVNGGQVANTLVQLRKFLKAKDVKLNAGFQIKTPSNYIPWGGPCSKTEQQQLFDEALKKIDKIADTVNSQKDGFIEKGPLWQNLLFSQVYNLSKNHVHQMDKKFWVDEKCNGCKICTQICPADNVMLINGKPEWNHKCHQCFACLQWCPQEAIQYGKKTPEYERYHHPEIKLREIME